MNGIDQLAKHVAVANTPMFVIERFRNDPSVRKLCGTSSKRLLANLKRVAHSHGFSEMNYRARAYAIIVSLYLKGDVGSLQAASELETNDPWLGEIARFLLTKLQFNVATYTAIQMPAVQIELDSTGVKGEVQIGRVTL